MTVLDIVRVVLQGDVAQLATSMRTAAQTVEQAGRRMQTIGSTMATRISLPIAAIGGISVKMASDFDASMRKIVGLVGVNKDVVDGWREDVRKLAVQYGTSASAAANALFFITSAGLRGADAMNTLEASLKGSAAGMGDISALADAATSAMNAYGVSNLSAERAVEVLTAAVRAGKLETETLAPVIGRILPTASAMGVSLEQVAGILAVFSRTGTDAAMGATSLQSVLSAMLKPGKQAQDALAGVGLTMAQLREVAAGPEGVVGVMRLLDETFEGNDEALAQIIPNVRAFRGVMAVLAQDSTIVDQVMKDVANSVGIVDEAFQASQGPAFQMRQAWSAIKDSFLELGEALIPVVVPAIQGVSKAIVGAVKSFQELPKGIRVAIGVFAGLVAAMGPVLMLGGAIVAAFGAIAVGGGALLVSILPVVGAIAGVALALGSLVVGVRQVIRHWNWFKLQFFSLMTAIADKAFSAVEAILGFFAKIPFIGEKFAQARDVVLARHDEILAGAGEKLGKLENEWEETARRMATSGGGLSWDVPRRFIDEAEEAIAAAQGPEADGTTPPPAWVVAAQEAMKDLNESLREARQLNELLGKSFELPEAEAEAYRSAIETMIEAGVSLDAQVGANGETLRELAANYLRLTDEAEDAAQATEDFNEMQEEAKRVVESLLTPRQQYLALEQKYFEMLQKELITQEQYNAALLQAQKNFKGASASAEDLDHTIQSFASRALTNFLQFTQGSSDAFKRFADDVIRELQRIATQFLVYKFLTDVLKWEVPNYQHGGYLAPGRYGIVGEAGPEVVQAGRSGVTVSPMHASASYGGAIGGEYGGPRVELTVNAVDARSFAQLVQTDPMAVAVPVVQAIARSNALKAALR